MHCLVSPPFHPELTGTLISSPLNPQPLNKAQHTRQPTPMRTQNGLVVITRYDIYTATKTVTDSDDQAAHWQTDTGKNKTRTSTQPSAYRIPALAA